MKAAGQEEKERSALAKWGRSIRRSSEVGRSTESGELKGGQDAQIYIGEFLQVRSVVTYLLTGELKLPLLLFHLRLYHLEGACPRLSMPTSSSPPLARKHPFRARQRSRVWDGSM